MALFKIQDHWWYWCVMYSDYKVLNWQWNCASHIGLHSFRFRVPNYRNTGHGIFRLGPPGKQ